MTNDLNYKEMMALRCAYNYGVRTAETRAAACLYVNLNRAKLLDKFKKESEGGIEGVKNNSEDLLRGICAVMAKRVLDRAEFDFHLMSGNKCAEYQIRLMDCGLCNVPFDSSSKRLNLAKKLEESGFIKLSQHRKGGIWSFTFANQYVTQKIYDDAFEVASKFEIQRGKGSVSLPQLTRTKQGFQEIERLGGIAYREISRVAIEANKKCEHGYDVACLLCGFGTENGEHVYYNTKKGN